MEIDLKMEIIISLTKSEISLSFLTMPACENLNRMMKTQSGLVGISIYSNSGEQLFLASMYDLEFHWLMVNVLTIQLTLKMITVMMIGNNLFAPLNKLYNVHPTLP